MDVPIRPAHGAREEVLGPHVPSSTQAGWTIDYVVSLELVIAAMQEALETMEG